MKPAILLCALGLSGCINLSAVTTPSPSRTAALDDPAETIEVSAGAALGFECWYNNFLENRPCAKARAKTLDTNIAQVFPAYLDHLLLDYHWRRSQNPVGFVVVGISPGTTILRIEIDGTNDEYAVTVVE